MTMGAIWYTGAMMAICSGLHAHWGEPGRAVFYALLAIGFFIEGRHQK